MIQLDLLLYDGDRLVPAATLLREEPRRIDVDSCAVSMMIDGAETLAGAWNLGRVDLVTMQVEEAVRRLRRGLPAIVRSAVLDRSGVPYHLFEPPAAAGEPAHVSRFFLADDPEHEQWFPLPGWGLDDPATLYDWVAAHREQLLGASASPPPGKARLSAAPVPFVSLVEGLTHVGSIGRQVLAAAGGGAPAAT